MRRENSVVVAVFFSSNVIFEYDTLIYEQHSCKMAAQMNLRCISDWMLVKRLLTISIFAIPLIAEARIN